MYKLFSQVAQPTLEYLCPFINTWNAWEEPGTLLTGGITLVCGKETCMDVLKMNTVPEQV